MTDWQPGDVALCVDDRWFDAYNNPLEQGREYTVIESIYHDDWGFNPDGSDSDGAHVLVLLEVKNYTAPPIFGFCQSRFVKQKPLIDEEKEKREAGLDAPVMASMGDSFCHPRQA